MVVSARVVVAQHLVEARQWHMLHTQCNSDLLFGTAALSRDSRSKAPAGQQVQGPSRTADPRPQQDSRSKAPAGQQVRDVRVQGSVVELALHV